MIDALFERRPRYLIFDEVDKMGTKDQTVLLSLMESGMVSETKYKRRREIQLKRTSVFATANSTNKKVLPPLLTRFCILYLRPYSQQEFREITKRILYDEERIEQSIAYAISDAVWTKMRSANIRDCIRIGRMVDKSSVEDVNLIVNILLKYDKNNTLSP
jgi:Holliday junction DNA helicase RuvB